MDLSERVIIWEEMTRAVKMQPQHNSQAKKIGYVWKQEDTRPSGRL
jgi:hypothetical protein